MKGKRAIGRLAASILGAAIIGWAAGAPAVAATRTGTTTIAVRVERHAAVVLPTSAGVVTYASFGSDRSVETPMSLGNGSSRILFSAEKRSGLTAAANRVPSARVEVTVFEP